MVKNQTKWYFLEQFLNEKEIHLNEISRRLKKPHTVTRRYLMDFEEEGIIIKRILGRQTFYRLNEEYPLIIDVLSIVEKEKLIKICEKNLVMKEIVNNLHEISLPILIFGSAVEDIKKGNDLDILVIGNLTKNMKEKIENLEKKINKKIHLVNVKSIDEVSEALKKEIFSKHLIINSTEMIIKWIH